MNIFQHISLYCVLILSPTLLIAQSCPITNHMYHQQTGSKESVFTWTMKQGEYVTLKTVDSMETTTLRCTGNGEVHEWHLQRGKNTSVTATRKEETIHISGVVDGTPVDTQLAIDKKPWYQFLSFSLQPFLKDNETQQARFWILSPRRLEMHMMEATKEGEEPVPLHDKETIAIKVRVAPDGLIGKLFYGHYWYRKTDFLWIKYQGDHGPLSPETVIHLQQENFH